jgi:hypothetical protein
MIGNLRFFVKGFIEVGAAVFCLMQLLRWLMAPFTHAFTRVGRRRY